MADKDDPWAVPGMIEPDKTPRGFTPPPTPPPPPLASQPGQAAGPVQPSVPSAAPPPGAPTVPPMYYSNPYAKNWMGIVALVAPFAGCIVPGGWIAGIVFGHLALAACKRGEANNRGLALAGLIISYVFTGLVVLYFVAIFGLAFADPSSFS